jgi:hypothetical protein
MPPTSIMMNGAARIMRQLGKSVIVVVNGF